MLPHELAQRLRSHARSAEKRLSFEDKIDLLVEWAGDDADRCAVGGIRRFGDDYYIDSTIVCRLMDIKERSLFKFFNMRNYDRVRLQDLPNVQRFRKRDRERSAKESLQRMTMNMVDVSEWDPVMARVWEAFRMEGRDESIAEFCRCSGAKTSSFVTPQRLIAIVLGSETINIDQYRLVYDHFGPTDRLFDRLNNFCVSVLSRNWCFGDGDRSVEMDASGAFIFRCSGKSVCLVNDRRQAGFWLADKEGRRLDIEGFFERYFPLEVPSEHNLIRFVSGCS